MIRRSDLPTDKTPPTQRLPPFFSLSSNPPPDTDGERGGTTGPTPPRIGPCSSDGSRNVAGTRREVTNARPSGTDHGAAETAPATTFVVQTDAMRPPFLLATAVAIALAGTALPRAQMTTDHDSARRLAQAKRLAERAPLIDGHNDLPLRMREQKPRYDFDVFDLRQPRPTFHTDIARLRAGGLGGQFWSVYVPGTLQGGSAVTADARADRLGAGDAAPLSRRVRGRPHRRRRRADRQGRPRRLDDGHGGRALNRRVTRRCCVSSRGWASAT